MDQARADALQEALTELGKSIAMGFVPYLGQAIDAYDTLESIWQLNASQKPEDKDEAKFQLVMALIGWIPGPGDGVKKSLRLVNKNPERFAPILFDLLRHVLELCEIKTSPEALLDQVFNASGLKAQITEIREAIEDSSAFEALPETGQSIARSILLTAEAELPMWVGLVSKKLLHWKRLQPNSSARIDVGGRKAVDKPDKKHDEVAKKGANKPVSGSNNESLKAIVSNAAIELANDQLGVLGEHIADYHCAEHFKWGKQWTGHDRGTNGTWSGGDPGKNTEGKLSNKNKLFKLSSGPNGTGLDAVWRAYRNNEGKPYAIVEAKSDLKISKPKFLEKNPKTDRKPSIGGKLGVSGVPELEELLETDPPIAEDATADNKAGGKPKSQKAGGKPTSGKGKNKQSAAAKSSSKKVPKNGPYVQMSHEWIDLNIQKAVSRDVFSEFRKLGQAIYSRHLIYTPQWLPAALEHAKAVATGNANTKGQHENHDVPANLVYNEKDIKTAINKKKTNLRKTFGNLPSLTAES